MLYCKVEANYVDEDIFIENSEDAYTGGKGYRVGFGEHCPDWITIENDMLITYKRQVWWYFNKNDGSNYGGTEILYS